MSIYVEKFHEIFGLIRQPAGVTTWEPQFPGTQDTAQKLAAGGSGKLVNKSNFFDADVWGDTCFQKHSDLMIQSLGGLVSFFNCNKGL